MCSGGAETHREVHVGITFSFFLSFQLSTMTTPTWILHILKCPHKNSYLGSSLTDVCFQACIFKTTEIKCFKYLHFNWNIIFLWPPSLYLSQSREKKKKKTLAKLFSVYPEGISWGFTLLCCQGVLLCLLILLYSQRHLKKGSWHIVQHFRLHQQVPIIVTYCVFCLIFFFLI